jgi:hypothetical protein
LLTLAQAAKLNAAVPEVWFASVVERQSALS